MESKLILDQAYSSCRGLLRLIKDYGPVRMEAACKRALRGYKFSYGAVKKILENKMDLLEEAPAAEYRIAIHANLRGPQAYSDN
jgi:hypothetical protein